MELLKYVWQLKKQGEEFKITWSINRRAQAYSNTTKRSNLCLTEKLSIINAEKTTTLTKRSELVSKCRHENKYYLVVSEEDKHRVSMITKSIKISLNHSFKYPSSSLSANKTKIVIYHE